MPTIFKRYVDGMLIEHAIDGVPQIIDGRRSEIGKEPWPLILSPLRILAKPRDRGAGDIIARVIGPIGGDAFKAWYKKTFGGDCGCGNRQEALNARWPL